MHSVYAMFDEREPGAVRYIGFSTDFERRHASHLNEARISFAKSHRLNWMRKVVREGAQICIRPLVFVATADEAAMLEIAAIASYRSAGHPLVNGTDGGEGVQGLGGVLSSEAMARRNASMNTPEYLAKRSEQSTDYWADEENRQHQREAMESHWSSEAGEVQRQIVIETNKRVQTGRKRSDATKEKMRQAKLGKPQMARTPEWKEKIAAAQRGIKRRPWTLEERERRSAAAKVRRQ